MIKKQPPTENIVNLLKAYSPRDLGQANSWFEALSGRIAGATKFTAVYCTSLTYFLEFSNNQKNTLRSLAFVPKVVQTSNRNEVVLYRPTQCYLHFDKSAKFHSKLFVFVQFSDKAIHFLRMCGVRDSPSVQEIAQILVNDPQEFLIQAGSREK
jgi:hypothetical protein